MHTSRMTLTSQNCMEYVRALTRSLSPDVLSHMSPPTKLIIIGCGEPSAIQRYTIDVPCPYEVYADPTRATYDKLAFVVSLSGGNGKPEYITRGFVAGLKESMGAMLAAGLRGGGKFSQNGGELIWVDGSLRFLHRMVDTTGHLEVKDLETELNKASSTAGEKENTDVAPIVAA